MRQDMPHLRPSVRNKAKLVEVPAVGAIVSWQVINQFAS